MVLHREITVIFIVEIGSFRTKNACEDHFEACKDYDFCYVKMPEEGSTLGYQEGSKSIRVPFVI